MRTVTGRTDHVVVVGAGLSGLAAALHLRGGGREVTVLERADHVGGRVGAHRVPGYVIDSGATVLTMPDLVYGALDAVGGRAEAPRMTRLDPAYHARFADGAHLDVHSDPATMAAEVHRFSGPRDADGYLALRRHLERLFAVEYDRFLDANFDSPLDLVGSGSAVADLARVVALGGFDRLGPLVARHIADPRLRRVFTFQALYAGLSPARALGVYGVIPYMDTALGVYFPEGGMRAVPESMARALTAAGGRVELDAQVDEVEFTGGRARAVRTADGRRFPCDALVVTADLPVADSLLRAAARPRRRTRWAPSAVVLHGTIARDTTSGWDAPAHHTIDFGAAWESTFAEITGRRGRRRASGSLMDDPSLLLTRPTLSDPGLAPPDRAGRPQELLSVLAPCPNLDVAPLDWSTLTRPYADELLATLETRGYHGIAPDFAVDVIDTPLTWARLGMGAGSPFSAAHTFAQTGPFRRKNLVPGVDNVVLAGCGTTPGVGVPTTLISGALAAERILGPRT